MPPTCEDALTVCMLTHRRHFQRQALEVAIWVGQPNAFGGVNYIPVANAVTGPDGMYYFRNIPPGIYVLQIGGTNYPLQVLPQGAQDIQAVLLRF